jgi:hypothetical protein
MLNRIDLQNVTKVSKDRSACIFTVPLIWLSNYEDEGTGILRNVGSYLSVDIRYIQEELNF